MKEIIFNVEFLSDIVLPATSNNEGKITQLDFIAGSNFLGIVAKNYKMFKDPFEIFHSGKVRFSDAKIVKNGNIGYKMPLSFFHEKLDDSKIFNHHLIKDFSEFNQLKQKRSGYITEDLEVVEIDYNYSQKSAYDVENRKSKDSQMYGYESIKKGSNWEFSLKYDESVEQIELIKEFLIGYKQLGKSKSSEYGLVKIEEVLTPAKKVKENININNEDVIVYFNSRVALFDEEGNPTFDVKYLCDGLTQKNIDYSKTQLRISSFTPYNTSRKTKDYERNCINSGSVVFLKDVDEKVVNKLKNGVGAYLSEGFGDVLINPEFLLKEEFKLKKEEEEKDNAEITPTTKLAKFLNKKIKTQENILDLLDEVDEFISKYKNLYRNITPSQWGNIRSIARSNIDNPKKEIEEYISHGVKKWEDKQKRVLLDKDIKFIELVAINLPKGAK